jgi:type I restriction enzyme S subunit
MSSKETTRRSAAHEQRGVPLPTLRFPGFQRQEWTTASGAAVFEQVSNKTSNGSLPVLAITQEHGAIPRELIDYHVTVTEQSLDGYKIVEVGDFIISLRSFQGGIEYSRYRGICSPAYIVLRARSHYSKEYFRHFFKTERLIQALNRNLEGIRDGKMVSWTQFSQLILPIPGPNEQKKIAECLSSLDELIFDERNKLDALKAHKNGLMQQLFPAEGEAVPRLRFPKFRSSPGWISEALGDLAIYENGKAYEPHISESGRFTVVNARFISSEGMIRKQSDADFCVAGKGDVLMVLSDLPKGRALAKCFYVDTSNQYAVNQRVCRLTTRRISSEFLYYALDRHPALLAYDDGLNQTHLRKEAVLACPISHPREKEEQQSIAQCLSSLNGFLASQSSKITGLVGLKAALLQQLFPSMDEVQA